MRELRINPIMLLSFCAALPLSVLAGLRFLVPLPLSAPNLILCCMVSVALLGLLYALDFLTRCLASVDGASGQ